MAITPRTKNFARGVGVYVIGADIVAADLLNAAADIDQRIEARGWKVASDIADTQRKLVPVGPDRATGPGGHTKKSIEWTKSQEPGVYYEIGPTHFIARFLEFGTRKMSPRPFVFPSASLHESDWEQAVADAGGSV